MNAEISKTIRARLLRFGMQISELLTQCKFVSAACPAHFNAHKPPKTVAPKDCHVHFNAHKPSTNFKKS